MTNINTIDRIEISTDNFVTVTHIGNIEVFGLSQTYDNRSVLIMDAMHMLDAAGIACTEAAHRELPYVVGDNTLRYTGEPFEQFWDTEMGYVKLYLECRAADRLYMHIEILCNR